MLRFVYEHRTHSFLSCCCVVCKPLGVGVGFQPLFPEMRNLKKKKNNNILSDEINAALY